MLWRILGLFFLFPLALTILGEKHSEAIPFASNTNPLIREEQTIVVDGVSEVWRLQWKSPPTPICDANDLSNAGICPCQGFAYGESGQLDLVRLSKGREIDRLELTPLFDEVPTYEKVAVVQHWPPEEKDFNDVDAVGFALQAHSRPVVKIMNLADYNHDGQSTEFFLQTGTLPCGKATGIVIGITPTNPRLHAFGTVLNPTMPLIMKVWEWKALLASAHPGEVVDWRCFDHASETETDLELSVSKGEIQGIQREFSCTEAGTRDKLLSEKPF
jgi:hypothetical protein